MCETLGSSLVIGDFVYKNPHNIHLYDNISKLGHIGQMSRSHSDIV